MKVTPLIGFLLVALAMIVPGLLVAALYIFGVANASVVPAPADSTGPIAITRSSSGAGETSGSTEATASALPEPDGTTTAFEGTMRGGGSVSGLSNTINERFRLTLVEHDDGTVSGELTIIWSDGEEDTNPIGGEVTSEGYLLTDDGGFSIEMVVEGDSIYSHVNVDETDEYGHWLGSVRFEGRRVE